MEISRFLLKYFSRHPMLPEAAQHPESIRDLLVLELAGLGDAVMLTPFFRALKQARPELRVSVLTSSRAAKVLENNPHIDCHYVASGPWSLIRLIPVLRRRRFDAVLNAYTLAAIIHKFGVSVDFLRKFRAESVFRCDYKASKLVEPNRDEARAPSGNSSARRGLYICVGAGSQGTVRWDTDGASVMRRAFVRDKTMPGAPRCDEKFPEPGHRF